MASRVRVPRDERTAQRFRHVLVDEFQDTSRAQWELVELLIAAWGDRFGETMLVAAITIARASPSSPSVASSSACDANFLASSCSLRSRSMRFCATLLFAASTSAVAGSTAVVVEYRGSRATSRLLVPAQPGADVDAPARLLRV